MFAHGSRSCFEVTIHEGVTTLVYKGQFCLGNRRYCYPLTITDYRSRYLLACEALESTKEAGAFSVFEQAFKEFGLPARCQACGGAARIIASITEPAVIEKILSHLKEKAAPADPVQWPKSRAPPSGLFD